MGLFGFRQKKKEEETIMYMIVGLGNPGTKYDKTRHNAGWEALDALAAKHDIDIRHRECQAETGKGYIDGVKVLLVKPLTYMNNSGEAVRELCAYYKLDPEEQLLVISDDINLDPGVLRIRRNGSAGGHNGLKDIIACTGTDGFARLRIGVGKKPKEWDQINHVLSRYPEEDRKIMEEAFLRAADAAALIAAGQIEDAMNQYNAKKKKEKSENTPEAGENA